MPQDAPPAPGGRNAPDADAPAPSADPRAAERRAAALRHPALPVAALSAVAVAYALGTDTYAAFILATAAGVALVGIGLNILLGLSGLVSFGHVGFFAIGAYCAGLLMLAGVDFWPALAAAAALSGLVGFALALPALRVSGPYLAMMTIAFAFIVEHGAIEWRALTGGANGVAVFTRPTLFGHPLAERELAILGVAFVAIGTLFYHRLARSPWGLAMTAVRDSETAAQSIGLNPTVMKTASFTLSAAFTGVAGALFTPLHQFITPGSFPFFQSILFILGVVVGGSGTLIGPIIGAALVVILPEYLAFLAEYRLLLFGALLLGVLWAAPTGFAGLALGLLRREPPETARASGAPPAALLRPEGEAGGGARLEVAGLSKAFGGVQAARDVAFTAAPGEITSVIGPNGAGKTTVLNMIGGFYRPDAGAVRLADAQGGARNLAGLSAHRVSRAGVSRTYQTTLLFHDMSVIDNVLVAGRRGRLGWLLGGPPSRAERQAAEDLLAFVGYRGPLARKAGALAHVDKRLVEIARALATRPKALLLDEPAAGLGRADKAELATLLRAIAEAGVAVVLVEHDMSLVMGVSAKVVVLDAGAPLRTGAPEEVQADPEVRRAYLGDEAHAPRPRAEPLGPAGARAEVLNVAGLTTGYGAAPVLEDVSLNVREGELVAVLGANGAGKSTMMRAVAGLHRPVSGAVELMGADVSRLAADAIAAKGLALVPEGRQVFPELSVVDNILLGAYLRSDLDRAGELNEMLRRFPRLADRAASPAGVLSGGEQQMLAIARGLIARPKILLLDEPSLGLAPAIIEELFDRLAALRDEGVTILIVDQMARQALAVADRAYVLESGRVVRSGQASELAGDASIEAAYLGGGAAAA